MVIWVKLNYTQFNHISLITCGFTLYRGFNRNQFNANMPDVARNYDHHYARQHATPKFFKLW